MTQHYPEESDPAFLYLKAFQSERLRGTFADFSAKPEYEAATFFFFNRLYGTQDTTDRDAAFRGIHRTIKRFLGGEVARSMSKLIELQEITLEMDHAVLQALDSRAPGFGILDYERVYRDCDHYELRLRQIELLDLTIRMVHRISHRFGIRLVLQSLHAACVVMGDTRMVDFLYDGYRAFADMKRVEPLAQAIVERETYRLNRIYGRAAQPSEIRP